jgi:hypothetical protein
MEAAKGEIESFMNSLLQPEEEAEWSLILLISDLKLNINRDATEENYPQTYPAYRERTPGVGEHLVPKCPDPFQLKDETRQSYVGF